MRLVHWFVTVPVAAVVVLFAVSNRDDVLVTLWPLPGSIDWPLYLVVLAALALGFLFGELVAWVNGRHHRRRARERSRRIETLERELAAKESQLAAAQPTPPTRTLLPHG